MLRPPAYSSDSPLRDSASPDCSALTYSTNEPHIAADQSMEPRAGGGGHLDLTDAGALPASTEFQASGDHGGAGGAGSQPSHDLGLTGSQTPGSLGVTPTTGSPSVSANECRQLQHGRVLQKPPPQQTRSGAGTSNGLTAIVPGILYLGSCRDVNDAAACAALGIGAYLCVAKEIALPAHAAGAPALHLPLVDGAEESLAAHVPAAVAFIDAQAAAGRRVALFCQAGRSRSASLAVAYVMRREGLDRAAALEHVRSRHPRADPNLSFLRQLEALATP